MKKLIFAFIASCTLVAVAASTATTPLTDAEKAAKKAAAKQKMLEKTGGLLDRPTTGKIAIVNCQKKISASAIHEKVAQLTKILRVTVETLDGEWKLGSALPNGANAALYIVDDAALPISLVATEAQWGVLNVAQLDEGPRFGKAFSRAAIMTFGAGWSQFKGSPMQTVTKPADLDAVVSDTITFDAMNSMLRNLQNLGVTQSRKTTYRKACEEGWAAAPTNQYQKAIWDEVHSIPTTPMKIEFDPKKGR